MLNTAVLEYEEINIQLQYVKNWKVITPAFTIRKKVNKLKINDF
jgi:hypothetical protein